MQKEAYFETAPPPGAFNSSLVTSCTFLSPGIPSKGRKGSKMKPCSERNFISGREFVQAWYGFRCPRAVLVTSGMGLLAVIICSVS